MTNWKTIETVAKNTASSIEDRLERNSDEKARAFVEKFQRSRGLWVLPHVVGFMFLFAACGTILMYKFHFSTLFAYAAGIIIAVIWWKSDFAKEHPFFAFIVALVPLCSFPYWT